MTRFLLDTGTAGLYLDRKRGVFERAEAEVPRAIASASPRRCWPSWPTAPKVVRNENAI
jgi:hypothetical protein